MKSQYALAALLGTTLLLAPVTMEARPTLYEVNQSPMAARIASKPGDLLTVKVSETLETTDNGDHKVDRSMESEFNFTKLFFPPFDIASGFAESIGSGDSPGVALDTENAWEGKVQQSSDHSVTMNLQARIIEEVMPGQFYIRAQRTLHINGQEKELLITGMIRQEDIDNNNTVPSELIAEGLVEINGISAGKHFAPNWLFNMLNTLY